MLKELRLNNIVLIESTTIQFGPGFNVLSGESGSGKSAIMNALNLIAGERCDLSILRKGAEKGCVEAVFDIDHHQELLQLLEEAGIDHQQGDDLFIRREFSISGKSRAFINHQLAQLSLLHRTTDLLFDIAGQHANQKLLAIEHHRQVLDLFGNLQKDAKAFAACWEEEMHVRKTLEQLIASEALRMRQIEVCRMEIEELEAASLKEGEEEELFAEYSQLSNADELSQKVGEINRLLTGDKIAILAHLNRQKALFDQLIRLAPHLTDTAASFENALLELHEVAHALRNFESRLEFNPQRMQELNERLELITRLKKKYGSTISDMQNYLKQAHENLFSLENADAAIDELQSKLEILSNNSNVLSDQLSAKRAQAALSLQNAVSAHLHALNMPKAEFYIEITPQKRTRFGDDKIEFFLMPNIGEHRVSLKECASGGELSRIMLALLTLLAGKENIPTIVFDEIDANIGGETATIVGEKIREIGLQRQVLCITHFPQVAKYAEHHLRIFKQEIDGRTITSIDILDNQARQRELIRMQGGMRQ